MFLNWCQTFNHIKKFIRLVFFTDMEGETSIVRRIRLQESQKIKLS